MSFKIPKIRPELAGLLLAGMAFYGWAASENKPILPDPHVVKSGEALLHGVPDIPEISQVMPASSVITAYQAVHAPSWFRRNLSKILAAATLAMVFTLGRMLHSIAGGLLAAFLVSLLGADWFMSAAEHDCFLLMVILTANIAVWRARAPNYFRSAVLGAAIGAGLLLRSTMALYPIVLFTYELFLYRKSPVDKRVKILLPVLIASYLVLTPWIYMNFSLHGRFIPFEAGRSDASVVTGALGLVSTLDGGDIERLSGLSSETNPLGWAIKEVLRHPIRYAWGCFLRAWHGARLEPILFLSTLAGVWVFRKREDHRQVLLLAAYIFGINCTIGTTSRFFFPAWPVFAALSAAMILRLMDKKGEVLSEKRAMLPVWACMVPVGCLSLFALGAASAYPHRSGAVGVTLDNITRRNPTDPWLLAERGRRRMKNSEPERALSDFKEAQRLDPGPQRTLDYAWVLAATGRPVRNVLSKIDIDNPAIASKKYLIEGTSLLQAGETDIALAAFKKAAEIARDHCGPEWNLGRAEESLIEARVCSDFMGATGVPELLAHLSVADYAAALNVLSPLAAEGARESAARAERRWEAGDRAGTMLALGQTVAAAKIAMARDPKESVAVLTTAVAMYQAMGEVRRAKNALKIFSDQAESSRLASLYGKMGRYTEAERVLRKLIEIDPSDAKLQLEYAHSALRVGKFEGALLALSRAELSQRTAHLYLEAARLGAKAGKKELVLKSLAFAETFSLISSQIRSMGRLYAQQGDHAGAARVLSRLVENSPEDVHALLEGAESALSAGNIAPALALLSRLEPRRDSPRLSRRRAHLNIEVARYGAKAGKKDVVLEFLAKAEKFDLAPGQLRSVARLYTEQGDESGAARVKDRLLKALPEDVSVLLDHAAAGGKTALRSLARIEKLDPSPKDLRQVVRLYLKMEKPERASVVLKGLLDRFPEDIDLLLQRVRAKRMAGDRAEASAILGRIVGSKITPEKLHEAALEYQALKEYAKAIEILRPLTRVHRVAARAFNDKGVCEFLSGDADSAINSFQSAIGIDPKFISAYASLGSLYTANGRRGDARKIYERALEISPSEENKGYRDVIRQSLQGLSPQ